MKKLINNKLKKLKSQYQEIFKEMDRIEYEGSAAFGYNKNEAVIFGINDWIMDYLQNGITLEELHKKIPIRNKLIRNEKKSRLKNIKGVCK